MNIRPIDGRRRRSRRLWHRAMRLLMILVFALIVGLTTSYALRTLNF